MGLVFIQHQSNRDGLFDLYVPNGSYADDMELSRGQHLGVAAPISSVTMVSAEQTHGAKEPPEAPVFRTPEEKLLLTAKFDKAIHVDIKAELRDRYMQMLQANSGAFSTGPADLGFSDAVQHTIRFHNTDPVFRQQFRLPVEQLDVVKENVANWLKLGVVEPSKSPYNAPIFCVPKPNSDKLRVVLDYRGVNTNSHPDRYCIRNVEECLEEIGQAESSLFSVCDVTAGFWQMALHKDSREATAFTIPGVGQFQWKTAPMGLTGSPASFCRLMDLILKDLEKVIAYVDDVLIHDNNHEEHIRRVESVLQRFSKNNVRLNPDKCVFAAREVQYLGRTISSKGVSPGFNKTAAVRDAPVPTTTKMVKAFAGLANYFRGFVPDFATKSAPLFLLLRKDSQWSGGPLPPAAKKAFLQLQQDITSAPTLALPRREGEFSLYVDAATGDKDGNKGGLGTTLWQQQENGKRVVAFASRRLVKHENNYPPFLLELAAAVYGMTTFETLLKGRHFLLYTDHKPLTRLSNVHTKTLNRLQLHMQDMHPHMRYIDGKNNTVADFLSRYHGMAANMIDAGDFRVRTLQGKDDQLASILEHANTLPEGTVFKFKKHRVYRTYKLINGVLRVQLPKRRGFLHLHDGWRVATPVVMFKEIISEAHASKLAGHGGIFKTVERIKEDFYWPQIEADVRAHIQACPSCQATTDKGVQPPPPLRPLPMPTKPGESVHIDTFGPLTGSKKGQHTRLCHHGQLHQDGVAAGHAGVRRQVRGVGSAAIHLHFRCSPLDHHGSRLRVLQTRYNRPSGRVSTSNTVRPRPTIPKRMRRWKGRIMISRTFSRQRSTATTPLPWTGNSTWVRCSSATILRSTNPRWFLPSTQRLVWTRVFRCGMGPSTSRTRTLRTRRTRTTS